MTLEEAFAEVRRVSRASDPWTGDDFTCAQPEHDPATIDHAIAAILNAVASGDLIPQPHEYTLSADAQRIVDTVKDAPQWDTTRDRLASPHGDMIPLADHRLAVVLAILRAVKTLPGNGELPYSGPPRIG